MSDINRSAKSKMLGLLIGFLFMVVMTPLTIWLIVKAVRAYFSKEIREDFIRRPVFHTVWAIAGALCLHGVISWMVTFSSKS